jgi:hypothetical protein
VNRDRNQSKNQSIETSKFNHLIIMATSGVSPSETTPLMQNGNATTNNGSPTISIENYTDGTNGYATPSSTSYYKTMLQRSLRRSASTFSEAMTSMKRIGYLGSMSISANSLTGPAMYVLLKSRENH